MSTILLNLQTYNISIFKKKNHFYIYIYNKNFFFFIKIFGKKMTF